MRLPAGRLSYLGYRRVLRVINAIIFGLLVGAVVLRRSSFHATAILGTIMFMVMNSSPCRVLRVTWIAPVRRNGWPNLRADL